LAGTVDIKLDFRNTFSSISLLKMTEIFSRMQPMQIMEICGSDPDTRDDLLKVLPEAAYDVLASDEEIEQDFYKVRIRKRLV
jgi:TusA-related sulfurtransferase